MLTVLDQIRKTGRFRFVRKTWRRTEAWELAPFINDEEVVKLGYALAGQGRDMNSLSASEQEELLLLLDRSPKSFSDVESGRQSSLLAQTGFTTYLGPIDIDINDESPGYNEETSKWKAFEYAKRLAYYATEVGLGNPNWYSVSWSGGFHADLVAPEDISDPDLLHAVRLLVNRLALRTEVPLYLRQPSSAIRQKSNRIDVYVDDSVLNKNADARGGLWRLPGKAKPRGKKKTLVDVLVAGAPVIDAPTNYQMIDKDALTEALQLYKSSKVQKKPEIVERPLKPSKQREVIEVKTGSLDVKDLSLLGSHSDLLKIWNTPDANRSYRDYNLALHATLLGADQAQAIRLVRAMPGSKAIQDRRGSDYDRSILNSVQRTIDRGVTDTSIYEGFVKPLAFELAHRSVIQKAIDLTTDLKIRNKLISTLGCGQATLYSESLKDGVVEVEGIHRCERVTCAYCEPRRIYLQVTEAAKLWPDKIVVVRLKTDGSINGGKLVYGKLKNHIRSSFKPRKAAKIISRLRVFRAPGKVLVLLSDITKLESLLQFSDDVLVLSRDECITELMDTLYIRFNRIFDYIKTGNAEALATDPWVSHVVSFSSGRRAKRTLPWLSKQDIRRKAKKEAQRFRGTANGESDDIRFNVMDNLSGRRLRTSRQPIPPHEVTQLLHRARKADLPESEWYVPQRARAPN